MTAENTTHWVWETYAGESGLAFVQDVDGLDPETSLKLLSGQPLQSPYPELVVKDLLPGRLTDLLGAYLGVHIVSLALRSALAQERHVSLQFLPLRIPAHPARDFFFVNVLDHMSCMDRERSRYSSWPGSEGEVDRIEKLVLKPIRSDAPSIFHLQEFETLVLVRDDLRRRLVGAGRESGIFIPAEEYRHPLS